MLTGKNKSLNFGDLTANDNVNSCRLFAANVFAIISSNRLATVLRDRTSVAIDGVITAHRIKAVFAVGVCAMSENGQWITKPQCNNTQNDFDMSLGIGWQWQTVKYPQIF